MRKDVQVSVLGILDAGGGPEAILCIDVTNDTRFFSCTTMYTFYTIVS